MILWPDLDLLLMNKVSGKKVEVMSSFIYNFMNFHALSLIYNLLFKDWKHFSMYGIEMLPSDYFQVGLDSRSSSTHAILASPIAWRSSIHCQVLALVVLIQVIQLPLLSKKE